MRVFAASRIYFKILIATTIVGYFSFASLAQEQREATVKPLVVLTGANSAVQQAMYQRIDSDRQFKDIWQRHLGPRSADNHPTPEVNFEHCLVIAVFQGSQVNQRGLRVDSMVEGANSITVRLDGISYQSSGDGDKVAPFAFIVLQKLQKTIVLEQNVQNLLGHSPVWKQVSRLPSREN